MDIKSAIRALSALAQETRLGIFRYLITTGPEGITPGKMAEQLAVPHTTLSFHLKELSRAGLVLSRPQSRFIHYSADYQTMNRLISFLTENCCAGAPCETASPEICYPEISEKPPLLEKENP
ncbi:MAG: helix-turn-helix transcriptional regulator [Nitrospirae bacterium]|nr:helix-turn-helix transcriptional regulator [Nitrospirota bacterium]